MKTAKDPRHIKRTKLIQNLFSWSFSRKPKAPSAIAKIISHLSKIDKAIEESAPSWPIGQINKIDLAILRLSVFELIIEKEQPPKVIVDEAIELGKEFGSEQSSSFINGALGKLISDKKIIN